MGEARPPGSGAPTPPSSASTLFGDRLPVMQQYAGWLAGPGVERGLLGPREPERLWERHLLNCAPLAGLVPADSAVADVGTGAGLPGLVLAIDRPDVRMTLIEPLLRRVTFLEEVVSDLALGNVEVLRARAEDVEGRDFDVVTSRAVAPLPRLAGWCLPLVRAGGSMLALKGERATEEVAEIPASRWSRSGCAPPEVLVCGAAGATAQVRVVRVRREIVRRVRLGAAGVGTS